MAASTLFQSASLSVIDNRCEMRPGDKPFVEQHDGFSVSYVRKGSFGYRSRGELTELVAGSILVGHPGDEYMCTHDHAHGDECLSFFLAPELVETIGGRSESDLRFGHVVSSEQKRKSPENLAQPGRPEDSDPFTESATINGAKLRDVDDAREQEPGLAAPKPNVPWHGRQTKIGCHHGDDSCGDCAPIEPVVLHYQRRAAPCWLGTFRHAEV